jgi:hypothetical protein
MVIKRKGGKRQGAGRKPVLSAVERLDLRARVEARLAEAARVRLKEMVEARNERFNLREKWARLQSIPVDERRRRQSTKRNWADDDDTVLDVRDAVAALYGSNKIEISIAKLRYGLRRQIVATVAKEKSKELRRSITPRLAERCLEEYRAISSRLPKPDV